MTEPIINPTPEEKITQMKDLIWFGQWETVVNYLLGKLEYVEEQIFEWWSEEYNKIKYTQYDLLKEQRKVLKWMIWLPWAIIAENKMIERADYSELV